MEKKQKAVVKLKPKQAVALREAKVTIINKTPIEIIQDAVFQKKGTIEDLKAMLAFQKDWEANEARKLFNAAFTKAQAEIQAVTKTKFNQQTQSKYADLSAVIESAKPVYTKYGFAVIFYESDTVTPEIVRIGVDVLHEKGHKESYHYDMPLDGVGIKGNANMTKIHGKSSSVAYGRRYLMCMIWNIPTQDDDGQKAGPAKTEKALNSSMITDKDLHQLRDLMVDAEANEKAFLGLLKVARLEDLPKDKLEFAKKTLAGIKAYHNR